VLVHGWQTNPERGVVRSRESFKLWWAPTISLKRLIVSGAVNLGGRSVWQIGERHRSQFITLTVDICVQHGGREALRQRHAGMSVAVWTRLVDTSVQNDTRVDGPSTLPANTGSAYRPQINIALCSSVFIHAIVQWRRQDMVPGGAPKLLGVYT